MTTSSPTTGDWIAEQRAIDRAEFIIRNIRFGEKERQSGRSFRQVVIDAIRSGDFENSADYKSMKRKNDLMAKEHALFTLCKEFVRNNDITCAESIYQSDRVIENSFDFIEKICDIIGYVE